MPYVPERGDVVWINLNPQAGHEQAGHRPVVILSPSSYNEKVGLMVCCPVTTQSKGYPFEVAIINNPSISGVILADQVKSLDWKIRGVKKRGEVSELELKETFKKLKAVIEP
jgi:mRNA interferase MazF